MGRRRHPTGGRRHLRTPPAARPLSVPPPRRHSGPQRLAARHPEQHRLDPPRRRRRSLLRARPHRATHQASAAARAPCRKRLRRLRCPPPRSLLRRRLPRCLSSPLGRQRGCPSLRRGWPDPLRCSGRLPPPAWRGRKASRCQLLPLSPVRGPTPTPASRRPWPKCERRAWRRSGRSLRLSGPTTLARSRARGRRARHGPGAARARLLQLTRLGSAGGGGGRGNRGPGTAQHRRSPLRRLKPRAAVLPGTAQLRTRWRRWWSGGWRCCWVADQRRC